MKNNLKIVDYNKQYESSINEMLIKQWNQSFVHSDKIEGKVALVDNRFAGCCFGWNKTNEFYLDTICVENEYQQKGIGTRLLEETIAQIKPISGCIVVYLLDNDGPGKNLPRAKRMFERLGFKYQRTIPKYFAKDNNYEYCPDCNKKPCECSAWEYKLKF